MSSIQRGLLCVRWQPAISFVRYRKVNVQKPFPPHFTRAKVEQLCKPYFPKTKLQDPNTPMHEICSAGIKYFEKQKVENPYVTLVGKDLLNWFNHSKLIAFFHLNYMPSDEMFEVRLALKKKLEMRVKLHGREIMTSAVKGTKYEAVLAFYNSSTMVAYGPQPDVKTLLKTIQKFKKIILLGAVVDERFMSVAELEFYASIPDLQSAQANLVAVLNSAAQGVVSRLNQQQSTLVQHLQTHVDLSSKKEPN